MVSQHYKLGHEWSKGRNNWLPVVNLIKHFTIAIYDSRVVWLGHCPCYDSRVVIYERTLFIRLATEIKLSWIINRPAPRRPSWRHRHPSASPFDVLRRSRRWTPTRRSPRPITRKSLSISATGHSSFQVRIKYFRTIRKNLCALIFNSFCLKRWAFLGLFYINFRLFKQT